MWQVQWGSSLKTLLDIQKSTGVTPPALANRPKLKAGGTQYLEAFYVLNASREAFYVLNASRDSNGYGLNPIKVGEVKDYALLMGFSRDETLKLLRLVQAMDAAFLNYVAEKNKTS